jgi:hypothetical protein
MGYQLQLFILTLVPAYFFALPPEYFDPNEIISGFSTCHIDLALFSDTQEFQAPPEIPVTVTNSGSLKQTENEEIVTYNQSVFCNMSRVKINCLAIFIISPNQRREVDNSTKNALNRYLEILSCYTLLLGSGYLKRTYLALVQHQNSNREYANSLLQWTNKYDNRQFRKLPIFYWTLNSGTSTNKVSVTVNLLSPCPFHISMELIGVASVREAFDMVFSIGQRKCSAIAWMVWESKSNATSPCVSLTDVNQFYEQQTAAFLSIVAEPFPNSTALYYNLLREVDFVETQSCWVNASSERAVDVYVGYEAAIEMHNSFAIYEIVYEEAFNFLTCDGADDYLSFEAYTSPIHRNLWTGILIISLMILLYLLALVHLKRIPAAVMLFLPSIFLEQPPQFSIQLLKYRSFKCLLIPLLLAATVLTNSYKSVVTTDLTAPFSSVRVESFEKASILAYKILPPFNSVMAKFLWEYKDLYINFIEIEDKLNLTKQLLDASQLSIALLIEVRLSNTFPHKRIQAQRMLDLIGVPEGFPNVSFQMEMVNAISQSTSTTTTN